MQLQLFATSEFGIVITVASVTFSNCISDFSILLLLMPPLVITHRHHAKFVNHHQRTNCTADRKMVFRYRVQFKKWCI